MSQDGYSPYSSRHNVALSFDEVENMKQTIRMQLVNNKFAQQHIMASANNLILPAPYLENQDPKFEEIRENLPSWINTAKTELSKLDSWKILTKQIKSKIEEAVASNIDSSTEAKRAQFDQQNELSSGDGSAPWRRLAAFSHTQQQSILINAAQKISSEQSFTNFVQEVGKVVEVNLDRSVKKANPEHTKDKPDLRVESLVKESAEAAGALLSRYPYYIMKPSMMRTINHQLPVVIRRHLWNSYLSPENRKRAEDFFNDLENLKGLDSKIPTSRVNPNILTASGKMSSVADTLIRNSKMVEESMLADIDSILHNTYIFMGSAMLEDSQKEPSDPKLLARLFDIGLLSVPILVTYASYPIEIKFKTTRDVFMCEKLLTFLQRIEKLSSGSSSNSLRDVTVFLEKLPGNLPGKILSLLQIKDSSLASHVTSILSVIAGKSVATLESLFGEIFSSARIYFVGVLDMSVVVHIWDQLYITEFDPHILACICVALLSILKEKVMACTKLSELHEVLKVNSSLITVEALTNTFQREFIRDLQQHYNIQIFPRDVIDLRGMEDEKAKLLFSQQSNFLGTPDQFQHGNEEDNDPLSVTYIWNDIWARFDRKVFRDVLFEGKRYTIMLLPRRVYEVLSCIEEFCDHTIMFSYNKDSYQLASRLGKEKEFKVAVQAVLLEYLAELTQEESNMTESAHEEIAALSKQKKFLEYILEVNFQLSINDVKFELLVDLNKLKTGNLEFELQERLKMLETTIDKSTIEEALSRAKLQFYEEIDQYKKSHENNKSSGKNKQQVEVKETTITKVNPTKQVENMTPEEVTIRKYQQEATLLFQKAIGEAQEGADLFFKGTAEEQREATKAAIYEKDAIKMRAEIIQQGMSTYEYMKQNKKVREKYDKQIEKEIKKNYKSKSKSFIKTLTGKSGTFTTTTD